MAIDDTMGHLIVLVFDHSSVVEGGESQIIGMVTIPFTEFRVPLSRPLRPSLHTHSTLPIPSELSVLARTKGQTRARQNFNP